MSQPGLGFSDVYNAVLLGSRGSALYANQNPPKYITGASYAPNSYFIMGGTVTTTINRCYYYPFSIWAPHTFQGAMTYNQGAGDNGEKIRLMVFRDADGGPGLLEKDFGEITLTGAAALRTLSSSWAAYPGTYWAAIWHETAASMYGMIPFGGASDAGAIAGFFLNSAIGSLNASYLSGGGALVHAHYVDTAYGAAPATAVAPTASLTSNPLGNTNLCPVFALKG